MTTSEPILLEQVREAALGTSEVGDAKPQEENGDAETHYEARHVKLTLSTEQTPTEAVDHADHRVQAEPEPPVRPHTARETDWGHIKAKLKDERNDKAKVAILHIECGDQEARP